MLNIYSERYPVLSGFIVAGLFTVVPGAVMLITQAITGDAGNAGNFIFLYALALELFMCFTIGRFSLLVLPFGMSLVGFIIAEIIYTVSQGLSPQGIGPDPITFWISSFLVTLFGVVSAGVLAAPFCYGFIALLRAGFRRLPSGWFRRLRRR